MGGGGNIENFILKKNLLLKKTLRFSNFRQKCLGNHFHESNTNVLGQKLLVSSSSSSTNFRYYLFIVTAPTSKLQVDYFKSLLSNNEDDMMMMMTMMIMMTLQQWTGHYVDWRPQLNCGNKYFSFLVWAFKKKKKKLIMTFLIAFAWFRILSDKIIRKIF